jgi:hypothetical protein
VRVKALGRPELRGVLGDPTILVGKDALDFGPEHGTASLGYETWNGLVCDVAPLAGGSGNAVGHRNYVLIPDGAADIGGCSPRRESRDRSHTDASSIQAAASARSRARAARARWRNGPDRKSGRLDAASC